MKKKKLEKVLWSVAKATCGSTSNMVLYEPKTPDELRNKNRKKEK